VVHLGNCDGANLTVKAIKTGVIDAGYPNSCSWVDYNGAPAFRREVGNVRGRIFITPMSIDGPRAQIESPNVKK
jgi:hypothetical protein